MLRCEAFPRRVVVIAACPYPALQGSQLLIKRLAEGLVRRGHEVRVVAYAQGLGEPESDVAVDRTPRVPGMATFRSGPRPQKLILDFLLLVRTVVTAIKQRAELLHAHNYEGAIVGLIASRLLGLPLVYHGHNAMAQELPTYFRRRWSKKLAARLGVFLDDNVPRRADHCIAVSRELFEFLRRRGVAAGGASYISPGAEVEEFPLVGEEQLGRLRSGFGLEGKRVLLYTGNLDLYQNLGLLSEALRCVLGEFPQAVLVLATHSAPESLGCPSQLRHAVRVFRTDSFAAIRDLLSVADVALCPRTEWSGFPMKLLNYMAAGKAIVASAGSAKGLRDGYNGLVVADGDAFGFGRAIVRILRDDRLRERLGENARRTALDHYSWERLLERVEEIYERVLAQRKGERGARIGWVLGRIGGCGSQTAGLPRAE